MTNKPRNGLVVYITFHVFLALASTLDWLRHYIGVLTRKEALRPEDALNWIQIVLLVACHGPQTGLALFLTMQCLASYLLASLSFGVHRTEHAWTQGDADPQLDFGRYRRRVRACVCHTLCVTHCVSGVNGEAWHDD